MNKIYCDKRRNNLVSDCINLLDDISLRSHSFVEKSSNWHYSKHKHDDLCEMMFVSEGKGKYYIDQKKYNVEKGNLIIVQPGVVHAERANPSDPITVWTFSFKVDLEKKDRGYGILKPGTGSVVHVEKEMDFFTRCCQEINRELREKEEGYDQVVQYLLSILLIKIRRISKIEEQQEPTNMLVSEVKRYIDTSYKNKISLNNLAKHFHVSAYYLSHQVKAEMGISPINYLIDRRIGESQKMLVNLDCSVMEIAEKVGYEDVNYFNRIFQKRIGMSPGEFRKLYRKNS